MADDMEKNRQQGNQPGQQGNQPGQGQNRQTGQGNQQSGQPGQQKKGGQGDNELDENQDRQRRAS